ncbi:MAG TPA: HlyD family efflux transporter periplasmic adaptor subunit [Pseudonocardia sp.]|nr:HlyD family efflux transporter periplasmic adaptor subunit [Pseudonocardia sp.]
MFQKAPVKRPLPRISRNLFILVAVLAVLETAAIGGNWYLNTRHFVTTDNAQVDGDQIRINAPSTGLITRWDLSEGQAIERNQVVGRVRAVGGGAQVERPVRAPGAGTVAVNDVTDGSYVTSGTELATAYDPASVYITARVDDTDVGEVHQGALVDISVDAYPKAAVTGIITTIQKSVASNFTYLPPPGSADPSNPRRVDQYVPVKIALTATGGARLVPGMNVTVHIHKQ